MLKVKLVSRLVTEYNDKYQDWSGSCFESSYEAESVIEDTSIEEIIKGVKSITFADEIKKEYITIEDGYINFSQIENVDGMADNNGRYLIDYSFIVERIERVALANC